MTALNKQAREEKARESFEQWAEQSGALPWGILKEHRNQDGSYPGPHYTYMWHAWNACHEELLDELEAAEKRIAELEAREVKLPKPISVLHRRDFNDTHRAIYAYPEAEVNAALAAAGIGVKGE